MPRAMIGSQQAASVATISVMRRAMAPVRSHRTGELDEAAGLLSGHRTGELDEAAGLLSGHRAGELDEAAGLLSGHRAGELDEAAGYCQVTGQGS